jgi:hypothetical protein
MAEGIYELFLMECYPDILRIELIIGQKDLCPIVSVLFFGRILFFCPWVLCGFIGGPSFRFISLFLFINY